VVCMGSCRLQSRTAFSGSVQVVSPRVFPLCMTLRCAWSACVCSVTIVLGPCAFPYSVWVAFVGFFVLVTCSSIMCAMTSESMSLICSDSKLCLPVSCVLSC